MTYFLVLINLQLAMCIQSLWLPSILHLAINTNEVFPWTKYKYVYSSVGWNRNRTKMSLWLFYNWDLWKRTGTCKSKCLMDVGVLIAFWHKEEQSNQKFWLPDQACEIPNAYSFLSKPGYNYSCLQSGKDFQPSQHWLTSLMPWISLCVPLA